MLNSATVLADPGAVTEAEREVADLRAVALGRLTGHFAHELRNVLTGVRCYLELLRGVDLPVEFGSFMGEIQDGLDRMTDLASLWHDVARSRCSTSYCNAEIQRLLHLLRAAGVAKRIQLEEQLDERAMGVRVAPEPLEAVLLALLNDLVERTPRAIRVETVASDDTVAIRLFAVGCATELTFGIETEQLSRLLGESVTRLAGGASNDCGYELRLASEAPLYR